MSLSDVVRRQSNIRLRAGLTDAELRDFQHTLPGPLPSDVADLLRFTTGFDVPRGEPVDFTGRSHQFKLEELIPYPVAVAKTDTGNFWVVDVSRDGTWGCVLFACHDPFAVCVAFNSLSEFIELAAHPDRLRQKAKTIV